MMKQQRRLWQRIYLFTLGLTVGAISVICAFLMKNSMSNMLEREKLTAGRNHVFLTSSIQNSVIYERLRQNKINLSQEELSDVFQSSLQGQNQTGVSIYLNGEQAYSHGSCPKQAEQALASQVGSTGQYQLSLYAQDGRFKLLVCSREIIQNAGYQVVSNTDITEVYLLHSRMMTGLLAISAASAVTIALLLALAVRQALSPLTRINREVQRIAQGEYHRRLPARRMDELGELSENMNQMACSIEEKVESLEQEAQNRKLFIDNLTHEMKTPLTTILGYGDMLRITQGLPEEKRQEYSGMIVSEAKRLQALSGKLMELISMEASMAEHLAPVPASALIERAQASIKPLFDARGVLLSCESEQFSLAVDTELFQSLLINLLDNAAKASQPGQTVLLTAQMEDGMPMISVTDHGRGIPQEDIPQVTEPFYMVDKARSRKSGGAGLGLALCARIAQLHGAGLTILSREGEGTCVKVKFKPNQRSKERGEASYGDGQT